MRITINKFIKKVCFSLFHGKKECKAVYWYLMLTKFHWGWPWEKKTPLIVYALDSTSYSCGVADRIRGMVGAYVFAKHNKIPFQIVHNSPFLLQDYLVPNKYNWLPKQETYSYNLFVSQPFININEYSSNILMIDKTKQTYYYSNMDIVGLLNWCYGKKYSFSEAFNELFSPSQKLFEALQPHLKVLESNYVSISFRFIDLLGDFIEGIRPILSADEQIRLIDKCKDVIAKLHSENPRKSKILVTADSKRFLHSVENIPYVYVVKGDIGHSGKSKITDGAIMKTFIDFYLISRASSVFVGVSGQMYPKSKFAYTAALAQNVPFKIIEF